MREICLKGQDPKESISICRGIIEGKSVEAKIDI